MKDREVQPDQVIDLMIDLMTELEIIEEKANQLRSRLEIMSIKLMR